MQIDFEEVSLSVAQSAFNKVIVECRIFVESTYQDINKQTKKTLRKDCA